ncbi:MAG TPA: sulfotransferase family 2 domain-containing protein [candidate division Zixibacteria bacterium]|nr:sulfotransferase family 2 domain-containing protein [candidate division Zixibacteria bacterium]
MIISHTHRYVFVELPRTGSTAIRQELRELYDGHPILHKHATYDEFLRQASPEERTYFSFAAVRNPLDDAVSRYFKLRTDHKGKYSGAGKKKKPRLLQRIQDERMYRFLERTDADFPTFFRRFYVLPYDTWASITHHRLDFVMRFENLAADFEEALRRSGLEPKRPLPVVNSTASRRRNFETYYTPDLYGRARRVFGPYMERWGYTFPEEWGVESPSTLHRLQYRAFNALARVYWRYLRPYA